jgi:hypothetical protein
MVVRLVPRTLECPQQSAEFFSLAVFLFDSNHMQQSTELVEECFTVWSAFIENHDHSEVGRLLSPTANTTNGGFLKVVGREEPDFLLKGLAALVRRCVQRLTEDNRMSSTA